MIPTMTMVAMPMYQVMSAASRSAMPEAFSETNAGPSTTRASPIVEGVSSPRGMAVTLRPVRRARRNAIQVYTRSPKSTPKAVPGNIRP